MQAQEAWLLDEDGFITEGAATNAWIVNADGGADAALGSDILAGITREFSLRSSNRKPWIIARLHP